LRRAQALVHGAQGFEHGQRRIFRDGLCDCFRARHQLGGGHHFVHEADAQGFTGIDGIAGEQQLERGGAAHQARQPLRAAPAA